MKRLVCIIILLIGLVTGAPEQDKMVNLPGYKDHFGARVYSGYLDTQSSLRKLHYVFIESYTGQNNTDPLTLWLNGGPGCTSKLGLLQQIPPYFLPLNTKYRKDMDLTVNPYSWLNMSNLLFIDSPAGVGFSLNNDKNYIYNDVNTAKDNLQALKHFFNDKFPQYKSNNFYIAGESYAGKYIPDLAVQIDNYNVLNPKSKMNLKGILIGNGVLNFDKGSLQQSQVQFMISHNFLDPKLIPNWQRACKIDPSSAGCQFFYVRFQDLVGDINPYNIYGPCFDGKTPNNQRSFLLRAAKSFSRHNRTKNMNSGCDYDAGVQNYFNLNHDLFHTNKTDMVVCNDTIFTKYQKTPTGSMSQMARILLGKTIRVYLFNGDWDDVVPFTDTLKNLQALSLKQQKPSQPWIIDGQHAGFIRTFSMGLKLITVKGAGHQVPQYQRQRAFQLFKMFLKNP